jgi:hypothetical protein
MINLSLVILDVVLGRVSLLTVLAARGALQTCRDLGLDDLDFILVLAGAPNDADWDEVGALAKEELVRFLEGEP